MLGLKVLAGRPVDAGGAGADSHRGKVLAFDRHEVIHQDLAAREPFNDVAGMLQHYDEDLWATHLLTASRTFAPGVWKITFLHHKPVGSLDYMITGKNAEIATFEAAFQQGDADGGGTAGSSGDAGGDPPEEFDASWPQWQESVLSN